MATGVPDWAHHTHLGVEAGNPMVSVNPFRLSVSVSRISSAPQALSSANTPGFVTLKQPGQSKRLAPQTRKMIQLNLEGKKNHKVEEEPGISVNTVKSLEKGLHHFTQIMGQSTHRAALPVVPFIFLKNVSETHPLLLFDCLPYAG